MSEALFSTTYSEARRRFLEAASAVGADLTAYKVDAASQDELAIDVAVVGADSAPAVVVSSWGSWCRRILWLSRTTGPP